MNFATDYRHKGEQNERGCRILVVEDSVLHQKLTRGLLEQHGYQVTLAPTGQDALTAISQQPFDLVLMDVDMPEMDGLQATRHLREAESESQARVPILGYTSSEREPCLDAGMDEHLEKPTRPEVLLQTISQLLTQADDPPSKRSA